MSSTRPVMLIALFALGCAARTETWKWREASAIDAPAPEEYPRAPAVVLLREVRIECKEAGLGRFTRVHRQDRIAVLTEDGFQYADVRILLDNKSEVALLRARTIDPSGVQQEVPPEEVHEEELKSGTLLEPRKAKIKVFRLPNVRVGSVIEWVYEVETPNRILTWLEEPISTKLPIKRYHAEVTMGSSVDFQMKLYNLAGAIDKKQGKDANTLSIDLSDVPAAPEEPLAPPRRITDARWAMRVLSYGTPARLRHAYDSWWYALIGLGARAYGDDTYDVFRKWPDVTSGCQGNRRCQLERAIAEVRDRTPLSGFEAEQIRPPQEVLASGQANHLEKATLLWKLLERAGVRAQLALAARDIDHSFDPKFPSAQAGDHLLVRVMAQSGIAEPLFVDPACEHCAPGQIGDWFQQRQAILLPPPLRRFNPGPAQKLELVSLPNDDPPPRVERTRVEAQLDAQGGISGAIDVETLGGNAVALDLRARKLQPAEWQKQVAEGLQKRHPAAQMRTHAMPTCDRQRAACQYRVEYAVPSYAAVDGRRLVLPLTLLRASDIEPGDEPRVHELAIPYAVREEETIVFRLPPGYSAEELPKPVIVQSTAVAALFEVSAAPGVLKVHQLIQFNPGIWPVAQYQELAAFLRRLATLRKQAITIAPAA